MRRESSATRFLTWPHCGDIAVRGSTGAWEVGRPPAAVSKLKTAIHPAKAKAPSAFAVFGEKHEALQSLRSACVDAIALAYVDIPRSRLFETAAGDEVSAWLTMVDSILRAVVPLLNRNGVVAVHTEDRDSHWIRIILEDLFGPSKHVATIAWQKKYGPQNDLRGRIDDAHDFIYVFGHREEHTGLECWSHAFAGKTEDATREVEALRSAGIVRVAEIPKTGKPELLVKRLLERFTADGDLLLEVFSDTAFASTAAICAGRIPIILAGNTTQERKLFDQCGKPRLSNALKDAGGRAKNLVVTQAAAVAIPPCSESLSSAAIALRGADETGRPSHHLTPILIEGNFTSLGDPALVIAGNTADVLQAAAPVLGSKAQLVWLDLLDSLTDAPRDEQAISALQKLLIAAMQFASRDGFLAIACKDPALAYIRFLAEQAFGRAQHAGTVVHSVDDGASLITLWRPLPADGAKIGFPAERVYVDDGHPDGPWRDPGHKGARSGGRSMAYRIQAPPYRWELVGGTLPPGCFRVSPETGVIYAKRLQKAGRYEFIVAVTDSKGQRSQSKCWIEVQEQGDTRGADRVWFLTERLTRSDRAPRITTRRLHRGVVGQPYATVLEAAGGAPFNLVLLPGTKTAGGKRTRYWELAPSTFVESLLTDSICFGSNGMSNPSRKKFAKDEKGRANNTTVELGWWDTDRMQGETAVSRMVRMVTDEASLIVNIGTTTKPISAKRRAVHFQPAHVTTASAVYGRVGATIGVATENNRPPTLHYETIKFRESLLWLEGFISVDNITIALPAAGILRGDGWCLAGVSPDGTIACVWLDPTTWPTESILRAVENHILPSFAKVVVYFFRGSPSRKAGLLYRRIPFDVVCGSCVR